mgnify:CR=1 FL=1
MNIEELKKIFIDFRRQLYQLFPRRRDAIFELMDANTASNNTYGSVTQLSNSEFFRRQYPSVTDALTDGLEAAEWENIQKNTWHFAKPSESVGYHRFVVDCTPNDRLHAKTLSDRSIAHKPNPAPGNKPICAGHEYSSVVYLPPGSSEERKRWVVPLSMERVPSQSNGSEFGINQLGNVLKNLDLVEEFTVSIADSAYASEACHQQVSEINSHIHIARLRKNRKVYELLDIKETSQGRPKIYGRKMKLNSPDSFLPHDEKITVPVDSKRGSTLSLEITGWNTVSFRGSREFKAHQHPFRLIRAVLIDQKNTPVFKRPLWIAVFGERRLELPLTECVENYNDRYDIEHYFRIGKQRLMMDSFQSAHTEHEENWWKLSALCYFQLYLGRGLSKATPEAWERYLPEFKCQNQKTLVSAPMAQRGIAKVLRAIGTPAREPVQRGNPIGRKKGQKQKVRVANPIKFKQSKSNSDAKDNISGFEKTVSRSKPKNIKSVLKKIHFLLDELNLSAEEFSELSMSVG